MVRWAVLGCVFLSTPLLASHHFLAVAACAWPLAVPPASPPTTQPCHLAPCLPAPPPLPACPPAAKCYSCLRVFCTRGQGSQPTVMSGALSESMTVAGMHDGIIRMWRTEDVFAGMLTGEWRCTVRGTAVHSVHVKGENMMSPCCCGAY